MSILFRLLFKDLGASITLGIAALLNIVSWVILWYGMPHVDFIPLSYNVHMGIDWTGPWWYSFSMPLLGLVILALNTFLAAQLFLKEKIISYFLVAAAALAQAILLASSVMVVLVNR